jgi:hypothetical protein
MEIEILRSALYNKINDHHIGLLIHVCKKNMDEINDIASLFVRILKTDTKIKNPNGYILEQYHNSIMIIFGILLRYNMNPNIYLKNESNMFKHIIFELWKLYENSQSFLDNVALLLCLSGCDFELTTNLQNGMSLYDTIILAAKKRNIYSAIFQKHIDYVKNIHKLCVFRVFDIMGVDGNFLSYILDSVKLYNVSYTDNSQAKKLVKYHCSNIIKTVDMNRYFFLYSYSIKHMNYDAMRCFSKKSHYVATHDVDYVFDIMSQTCEEFVEDIIVEIMSKKVQLCKYHEDKLPENIKRSALLNYYLPYWRYEYPLKGSIEYYRKSLNININDNVFNKLNEIYRDLKNGKLEQLVSEFVERNRKIIDLNLPKGILKGNETFISSSSIYEVSQNYVHQYLCGGTMYYFTIFELSRLFEDNYKNPYTGEMFNSKFVSSMKSEIKTHNFFNVAIDIRDLFDEFLYGNRILNIYKKENAYDKMYHILKKYNVTKQTIRKVDINYVISVVQFLFTEDDNEFIITDLECLLTYIMKRLSEIEDQKEREEKICFLVDMMFGTLSINLFREDDSSEYVDVYITI